MQKATNEAEVTCVLCTAISIRGTDITFVFTVYGGGDSVVGVAISYVFDGPGFELRWKEETFTSPYLSRPFLGLTQPLLQQVSRPFPWG